jgi:hypothetical protein
MCHSRNGTQWPQQKSTPCPPTPTAIPLDLDVWVKKTKNGDDWVSVKVGNETVADQPKQDAHSQAKSNGYQPQSVADMKDDIPF